MKEGFWIIVNFTREGEPPIMQPVNSDKSLNECLEMAKQLATLRKHFAYWVSIIYSISSGEEEG